MLLDRIELELHVPEGTEPPAVELFRAFEKVEAGTYRFTEDERECVEDELRRYADTGESPDRDAPVAERVVERLG